MKAACSPLPCCWASCSSEWAASRSSRCQTNHVIEKPTARRTCRHCRRCLTVEGGSRETGMRLVVALIIFLIVSHACAADTVFPSSAGHLKVQTVANGLVNPWSLAFLPDGRMLVTERPGRMRIVAMDGRLSPPIGNVPKVYAVSQAGLMDVLLARDFAQSHTIFVCYAEAVEGGGRIAILRARLIDDESPRLDEVKVIFRQKGPVSRGLNIGCRMVQAPDGNLFVTLGDHFGPKEFAQKLDNHIGKIVRITPDGAPAADNPFVGTDGALPEIWAYGLRNAQGLAFNPTDGKLWEQEHGPMGGDEIKYHRERQKLRLAARELWRQLRRHTSGHRQVRDGGRHKPDLALDAFDRSVWYGFLHGRPYPRLEGQLTEWCAEVRRSEERRVGKGCRS